MSSYDLAYRTSYWCEREPDRLPSLPDASRADVAVVGGGYAGLSSARCLKEADPSLEVALLEAEYVGFGASGRNAGGVSPLPPATWLLDDLAQESRLEDIRWAVGYINRQTQELKAMIDREGIDCDFHPAPIVLAAPGHLRRRLLESLAERCAAVGLSCRTVQEAEMRDDLRYPARGGLVVEGQMLQPYSLARGLLRVVRSRGVRAYEGTRVSGIVKVGGEIELLTTEGARLRTSKLILATNAYTPRRRFGLGRFFPMPSHTYMLATEPLPAADLQQIGFGGTFIGDLNLAMNYMRVHGDRLLFGGGGKMFSKADTSEDQCHAAYAALHASMVRHFPFLSNVGITSMWGGPIHETLTDAPIVKVASGSPDVVLNVGYSSSGVALTQFSGKMVAGLVLAEKGIDPEAERLRRMYESSRVPWCEAVALGIRCLLPQVRMAA